MATPKPRRPIAGSRTPSPAPRKIAGRGRIEPPAEVPEVSAPPPSAPPPSAPPPSAPPYAPPSSDVPPGLLAGAVTTRVLVAVLVVLALVGGGELFYLLRDPLRPSDDRPVTVTKLDTRLAVEDATRQLSDILTFTWRNYDEEIDDALARMEDGDFKDEWRQTAEDTRTKVLAQKAEYSVQVKGSGVIEAGPDEVTTLVFLDQIVFRGQGADRVGPEVYPFRIEITTVRDGDRWLVSGIEPR